MTSDAATSYPPVADEEAEAVLGACRVLVGVSAQSIAAAESVVDIAEFRILVILATLGSARISDLADKAEIHLATARRLCGRLGSAKFVTISGSDPAHKQTVALSAQGQGVVHMVMSRRRAAIEPILIRMPTTGRAALVVALRQFTRAAGEPSVSDLWAMGWTQ